MDDGRFGDTVHVAQGRRTTVGVMDDGEDKVGENSRRAWIQVEADAEKYVPSNVLVNQRPRDSVDDIDHDIK